MCFWAGEAGVYACDDGAEMRAGGREAQRFGECGVYEAASYVFEMLGNFRLGIISRRMRWRLPGS